MVKALVTERKKRSTAGSRMTSLLGQAVKDDEEFWNHSTWNEEGGEMSDDGSFRESDEESDAKVDTFDSDFDDSEGEDEDEGGGEDEVLREERDARSAGKKRMMDNVNAGRALMQKKKNAAKRKKAIRGNDDNAGLVLNFPGATPIVRQRTIVKQPIATVKPPPTSKVKIENMEPSRRSSRAKVSKYSVSNVVGKRSLRTSTINNSIEASTASDASTRQPSQTNRKSRHKRKFGQNELLLEAISTTEGENQRWLLNRKRLQTEENTKAEMKKKLSQQSSNKKVISKFNSRRGCLNTFTFPEMDHVPDIFTQQFSEQLRTDELEKIRKNNQCVITGKKARYRDPKSKLGYHDAAAFKELRRRFDAGEILDQRSEPKPTPSTSSSAVDKKAPSQKKEGPIKQSLNVGTVTVAKIKETVSDQKVKNKSDHGNPSVAKAGASNQKLKPAPKKANTKSRKKAPIKVGAEHGKVVEEKKQQKPDAQKIKSGTAKYMKRPDAALVKETLSTVVESQSKDLQQSNNASINRKATEKKKTTKSNEKKKVGKTNEKASTKRRNPSSAGKNKPSSTDGSMKILHTASKKPKILPNNGSKQISAKKTVPVSVSSAKIATAQPASSEKTKMSSQNENKVVTIVPIKPRAPSSSAKTTTSQPASSEKTKMSSQNENKVVTIVPIKPRAPSSSAKTTTSQPASSEKTKMPSQNENKVGTILATKPNAPSSSGKTTASQPVPTENSQIISHNKDNDMSIGPTKPYMLSSSSKTAVSQPVPKDEPQITLHNKDNDATICPTKPCVPSSSVTTATSQQVPKDEPRITSHNKDNDVTIVPTMPSSSARSATSQQVSKESPQIISHNKDNDILTVASTKIAMPRPAVNQIMTSSQNGTNDWQTKLSASSIDASSNTVPTILSNLHDARMISTDSVNFANRLIAQNMLNNNLSMQSQFLEQNMSNMAMNQIQASYQSLLFDNMRSGINQNIFNNCLPGNPAMQHYGPLTQLPPSYQQMYTQPTMDVASMLAMSLNPHGVPMQSVPQYPQQLQHSSIQPMNAASQHDPFANKNGSSKKSSNSLDDERNHKK